MTLPQTQQLPQESGLSSNKYGIDPPPYSPPETTVYLEVQNSYLDTYKNEEQSTVDPPERREDSEVKAEDVFASQITKCRFIRRVYLIIISQLLLTFITIVNICLIEFVNAYLYQNAYALPVAVGALIFTVSVVARVNCIRRVFPRNLILLVLFTLAQAVVFSNGLLYFEYDFLKAVLLMIFIMTLLCVSLILFTFQSKWDFSEPQVFTFCVMILVITNAVLCGITALFFAKQDFILPYASVAALLFSSLLIIDTQSIFARSYLLVVSPKEYVFGALILYLDSNIFIRCLFRRNRILCNRSNNNNNNN